jgi:PAS domain S-box-containing protein
MSKCRRAEELRAWLTAIFESSNDAIIGEKPNGIVTSWSPGATRLFIYEPQEIIGKSISAIVPSELHAEHVEILDRLSRGERVDQLKTVRLAKDGQRIEVSLTVAPIKDGEGEIVGALKMARDVGERRRLERIVRRADLGEDEFLASLAHELRNPLAPIRTATELLRAADFLSPELRVAAAILDRQTRQLVHLVDDLLDVYRIAAGHVRLQHETVELVGLLRTVIDSDRILFEAGRHEVALSPATEPLHVDADRIRISQVFSNILRNAAKYTPPGGRIRVGVSREADEAVVSICDNGVGIAPDRLSSVFELFGHLDNSGAHADEGLGIGLGLAKGIVELHGGRIEARSEGINEGSEFLVRLPVVRTTAAKEILSGNEEAETKEAGRRILIADDNRDAAVSLGMLLESMGHETRIACSGREALEGAEDFRPDVVLLDLGMPGLDGYQTARLIAERPWADATLLVAVTGWPQEAVGERARAAGFHRHVVKPVGAEALRQLLEEPKGQRQR